MLAITGWALDLHGVWPLVLSLDSGRAMVCARQAEIGCALTPDGSVFLAGPDCSGPNYSGLGW